MEATNSITVQLELTNDSVALLETIARKQGRDKEDLARQAIELWLETFRNHGPAFSRRSAGAPAFS
jgi:hypothetical protein